MHIEKQEMRCLLMISSWRHRYVPWQDKVEVKGILNCKPIYLTLPLPPFLCLILLSPLFGCGIGPLMEPGDGAAGGALGAVHHPRHPFGNPTAISWRFEVHQTACCVVACEFKCYGSFVELRVGSSNVNVIIWGPYSFTYVVCYLSKQKKRTLFVGLISSLLLGVSIL